MRVPKAYPIYDSDYEVRLQTLRRWLDGMRGLQSRSATTAPTATTTPTTRCSPRWGGGERLRRGPLATSGRVDSDGAYLEEDEVEETPYRDAPPTKAMSLPLAPEAAGQETA